MNENSVSPELGKAFFRIRSLSRKVIWPEIRATQRQAVEDASSVLKEYKQWLEAESPPELPFSSRRQGTIYSRKLVVME